MDTLLGNFRCLLEEFPSLSRLNKSPLLKLSPAQRFERVCRDLLQLILESEENVFLLKAVASYLQKVNEWGVLEEPLSFTLFEFWLNHFSKLSAQELYLVRAKIAGKHLPREDYSALFPVGLGQRYSGSHFVSAHFSPDMDTTIASFWGWVDAFAAQVAESQHLWNLPGGVSSAQARTLFDTLFGPALLKYVPRTAHSLTLGAMDLLTQASITKAHGNLLASQLDHGVDQHAILYVNQEGHYFGDWRGSNFEPVRQILLMFNSALHWFENNLHIQLISFFSKPRVTRKGLTPFFESVFTISVKSCAPVRLLTRKQRTLLNDLFVAVFGLQAGIKSSFGDLLNAFSLQGVDAVTRLQEEVDCLKTSSLFTAKGQLKEDRPAIFQTLHRLIHKLDLAIHAICNYVDRLDSVMQIKHNVLGYRPQYATLHSDVEELRIKMGNRDYLTIVIADGAECLFPVGIVTASALRKPILGSISQRDFCNENEMRMASYLEVISVIDHHKASLQTNTAPQTLIGDAQSSNVLVAEQAFQMNERYSTGGMTLASIESQIAQLQQETPSFSHTRRLQRLLHKRMAHAGRGPFFINPQREYVESLCFLHAILDDTDLLTKVTKRDVFCVAQLLNKMKTLSLGREVETIHFDDLPLDEHFTRAAAQQLLQNEDLYSLYGKIYAAREEELASSLQTCIEGTSSSLFSDTKEQNGCCRVGQIKRFASNIPLFKQHESALQTIWLEEAAAITRARPEIDLHLQMLSTIASAQEVYKGKVGPYKHQDRLWFWIAPTQTALDHLGSLLSGLQTLPELRRVNLSLELIGPEPQKLEETFARNFSKIQERKISRSDRLETLAVLSYPAGTLNSRKAKISPYLPHLVS